MSGNRYTGGVVMIGNKKKGYFYLQKLTVSTKTLEDFSDFNKEDYYIYKKTGNFRIVEDYEDFKYAGYIFFLKEKYNKEHIDCWLDFLTPIPAFLYLNKPTPPFNPNNKIKIMN